MATVTGLTAARMLAIEAASIVDGNIDGSGHLILTKHDGSTVDAGDALVAVPEEDIVKILNGDDYSKATLPINYPAGASLMRLTSAQNTAGGWTEFTFKYGIITTYKADAGHDTVQVWQHIHDSGGTAEMWIRGGNFGGWGDWKRLAIADEIGTLASTYLAGMSSGQQLLWGGDTNLYRSAASRLATDDRLDPKPMQAIFRRAAGLTIATGTNVVPTYDTTVADLWSIGNSSGVVTIPAGWGGLWTIKAQFSFVGTTGGPAPVGFRLVQILKTGSIALGEVRVPPVTFAADQPTSISISVDEVLAAGDTVWVNLFHVQGSNLTYTGRFSIAYNGRVV